MNLNERIKKMREDKGLTQKKMADKLDMPERMYAYYEQDRFPKSEEMFKKIADALGTTVAILLGEESNDNKFVALARSAESLGQDDREKLLQIFEQAIDLFSKKK